MDMASRVKLGSMGVVKKPIYTKDEIAWAKKQVSSYILMEGIDAKDPKNKELVTDLIWERLSENRAKDMETPEEKEAKKKAYKELQKKQLDFINMQREYKYEQEQLKNLNEDTN